MSDFVTNMIGAIDGVVSATGKKFRPLHEPLFVGNELKYVSDCINTGWVSSVGAYVDRFEKDLAAYLGVKRVIAAVNGTAALHLCLEALGVGEGDEVLMPTLTFVATANAISYTGATPHFCDSESETLGICPQKLDDYLANISASNDKAECINKKTGKRIAAIIPMHVFGHPVKLDELIAVAKKYNIAVVEDAAESLGSSYRGKMTGGIGLMGAISFNGNKIITTGGGGAIATNDEELANRLKHLSTTAKTSKEGYFFHDQVGYNYRMPNINAALGCAQLEKLPEYLKTKRKIAELYKSAFSKLDGIKLIEEPKDSTSNYWLCSAILDSGDNLNSLLEETNKQGIMTRPLWNLMHTLPMHQACPRMDLSVAEDLVQRVVSLPSSVNLVG